MKKHKMHWWIRIFRKLFGKHPNVRVKETVTSFPSYTVHSDFIDDGIDPEYWI